MKYRINHTRRSLLIGAVSIGIGGLTTLAVAQSSPRIIKVTAQRFRYTPNRIAIKHGETVTLELTSLDVPMGFNAPAFMVRANVLPEEIARVQITADKAGEFDFFCDVFCGNGHAGMRGKIVVS
jgi:cytochrome c oxidase subunit 2